MKIVTRFILGVLLSLPSFAEAQQTAGTGSAEGISPSSEALSPDAQQLSAPVYFRLGKSTIDPGFMGNHERIESFISSLEEILSNPGYVVSKVRVVGMASPDGARSRNEELAGARAQALADLLVQRTGISPDKIEVVNGGENWDGLFAMIEASKDIPDKAKMLEFREVYGEDCDKLKRNMQDYNGSRAWKYMYQHFFPILRTGAGGTDGDKILSGLSLTNWRLMREIIQASDLDEDTKRKLQEVLSQKEIENLTDAGAVLSRLRALCPDDEVYARLERQAVEGMLGSASALSKNNWARLRELIVSSDMQGKDEALRIIDETEIEQREQKLREIGNGDTYKYIADNFYPQLLTSDDMTKEDDGDTAAILGEGNWQVLRQLVAASDMPDKAQVLAIIDSESDPVVRERKLRELNSGQTYRELTGQAFPALLSGGSLSSGQRQANRALLREWIAASNVPNKEQVLTLLEREDDSVELERQLRLQLGAQKYHDLVGNIVPRLLSSAQPLGSTTTLSAANWKKLRDMIASSDMPDKAQVLAIIDSESDPVVRERKLRELNDGYPYRYIQEVFFPELLYGLSGASQESWTLFEDVVRDSNHPNKDKVLEIIRMTPPGPRREAAIRALDDSKTWNGISRILLPKLLQNTEDVEASVSGTGMSVTFEASPAAKARAAELKRQQEEARLAEERRREEERKAEEAHRLAEQRRIEEEKAREAARLAAIERRRMEPVVALKTDFVLWGSLMPGFEMGSFTPNLSAEAFFARRWSVQLGGAYSNWDALGGDYGLYAVTAVDLEPRWWLKDDGFFRGFFAGVYGTYGDFDIQQKDGLSGTTGTYFMGGLSVGWSQVLGRHLFLEAGVRLGYRSANGEGYSVLNGHSYTDGKETLGKFAPQVRLQLVYRFGKSGKSVK